MSLFTVAIAILSILGTCQAQNTTCTPLEETDSLCGVFSPIQSVFYFNQAEDLEPRYFRQLRLICPDIVKVEETFPFVFCLGAMGPCNGGSFVLPEVKEDGSMDGMDKVSAFYNEAQFGMQLNPAFQAAGVLPPCYEACDASMQMIRDCPSLQQLGISKESENCLGFPKQEENVPGADPVCVMLPGKKTTAAAAGGEEEEEKKDTPEVGKEEGSGNAGVNFTASAWWITLLALFL